MAHSQNNDTSNRVWQIDAGRDRYSDRWIKREGDREIDGRVCSNRSEEVECNRGLECRARGAIIERWVGGTIR